MTVSSTTTRSTFSGNGSTTAFATGFFFIADGDVKVILRNNAVTPITETVLTITTHYTLSGSGSASGGTVTMVTAPASTEQLIIKRAVTETQTTDLPSGGAFPAATVEEMTDKVLMMIQAHSEELARAVVLAETSTTTGLEIPEPTANNLIGWNSAADQLENKVPSDVTTLTTVTTFIKTLLDDSDAGAARTTLGAGTSNITAPSCSTSTALVKWNSTSGGAVADTGLLVDSDDNLSGHGAEINAIGSTVTAYTLVGTDSGKVVRIDSSDALALTLPQATTEIIAQGFQCTIIQNAQGAVTVGKQGSDTLNAKSANHKLASSHAIATVMKLTASTTTSTWGLYGDLVST